MLHPTTFMRASGFAYAVSAPTDGDSFIPLALADARYPSIDALFRFSPAVLTGSGVETILCMLNEDQRPLVSLELVLGVGGGVRLTSYSEPSVATSLLVPFDTAAIHSWEWHRVTFVQDDRLVGIVHREGHKPEVYHGGPTAALYQGLTPRYSLLGLPGGGAHGAVAGRHAPFDIADLRLWEEAPGPMEEVLGPEDAAAQWGSWASPGMPHGLLATWNGPHPSPVWPVAVSVFGAMTPITVERWAESSAPVAPNGIPPRIEIRHEVRPRTRTIIIPRVPELAQTPHDTLEWRLVRAANTDGTITLKVGEAGRLIIEGVSKGIIVAELVSSWLGTTTTQQYCVMLERERAKTATAVPSGYGYPATITIQTTCPSNILWYGDRFLIERRDANGALLDAPTISDDPTLPSAWGMRASLLPDDQVRIWLDEKPDPRLGSVTLRAACPLSERQAFIRHGDNDLSMLWKPCRDLVIEFDPNSGWSLRDAPTPVVSQGLVHCAGSAASMPSFLAALARIPQDGLTGDLTIIDSDEYFIQAALKLAPKLNSFNLVISGGPSLIFEKGGLSLRPRGSGSLSFLGSIRSAY